MIWVVLIIILVALLIAMTGILVYMLARLGNVERMLSNALQFAQRARHHTVEAVSAASHAVRHMATQDPTTGIIMDDGEEYRYREPQVVHDIENGGIDGDVMVEDYETEHEMVEGYQHTPVSPQPQPVLQARPIHNDRNEGRPSFHNTGVTTADLTRTTTPIETAPAGNGKPDPPRYAASSVKTLTARRTNGRSESPPSNGPPKRVVLSASDRQRLQRQRQLQQRLQKKHQRSIALNQKQQQQQKHHKLSAEDAGNPPSTRLTNPRDF